jgi:cell division transport system ATP-binding protein
LADVSLTLEAGGFHVLTGAADAGKTTLLNIIALVEPPSAGRLNLFDADTARLDRAGRAALRRRIGIVFQDLRLIDRLTVRDNVALPLRISAAAAADGGRAGRRTDDHVAELLAWLGLADCAERPAANLSGGERRLVALARAIIDRPLLLIADEPAAGLAGDMIPLLVRVFEQINRLGTTVLIATQDSGAAFDGCGVAHRRFRLDDGRLSSVDAVMMQ